MTIVEFLEARLAEDEAVAQAAFEQDHVHAEDGRQMCDSERCAHDLRHSPARVLRDVAAKRAILEIAASIRQETGDDVEEMLAAVYSDHPDYTEDWPWL